jgi:hypothetical protein
MPGETIMTDDQVIATQATELLRTLIRNACVNTGEPASGNEARSGEARRGRLRRLGALLHHGNNERVDVESLRLSALTWEALCRDFLG